MFKHLIETLKCQGLLVPAVDRAEQALSTARKLTDAAMVRLLEGKPADFDVYATDREINAAEVEVRRMVFSHLATSGNADLVTSVTLLSTVIDIERIGDYAKNLYQHASRLDAAWPAVAPLDEIASLRVELMEMFADTEEALKASDHDLAKSVMHRQSILGPRCESILDGLCESTGVKAQDAVVGALTTRYFKRIGSHLSNLCSSVINPVHRIGFRPDVGSD